jgi:hypothetical protein
MNLSKVVIGTENQNCTGYESEILHDAGILGLRKLAGFTPQKMSVDENALTPILSCYQEASGYMAVTLCSNPAVRSHQRIPYLVLAWMLIGRDNPARLTHRTFHDSTG